ncbi:MAG: RnfH family protein [Burkholderiales bacterium]
MKELINVEVCFALPERQAIIELQLGIGSTVADAIAQSKILGMFPQIDLRKNRVGIYARLVNAETVLRDGDRVEIYRELVAEPRDARRVRAAKRQQKT